MLDVEVIEDPDAAMAALDPIKARLLAELSQPASAASLAARVGLPRQKVNYHLRALEHYKLVEPAEERRWGGLTERLMVATAAAFVVSLFLAVAGFGWPALWRPALALFVGGWVFQFIGHAVEGKPPEFFKDWRFLFVGLRWWLAKLAGKA